MKDRSTEGLQEYVADRVRRELTRRLGENFDVPEAQQRLIVEDAVQAGVEEIDYTIELVRAAVAKLRDLSPLWDMYKDGIDLNSVEWVAH